MYSFKVLKSDAATTSANKKLTTSICALSFALLHVLTRQNVYLHDKKLGIKSVKNCDFALHGAAYYLSRNCFLLQPLLMSQCHQQLVFFSKFPFLLYSEPPAVCLAPQVSDVTKSSCMLTWAEPDDGGSMINGEIYKQGLERKVQKYIAFGPGFREPERS